MIKEKIELSNNFEDNCLLYSIGLDLRKFDPIIGNIFRIFIPERFFLRNSSPILNRNIIGSIFYDPSSDLVAIAAHCGCLFSNPKKMGILHRRWCTVRNFYESLCFNDNEYLSKAEIYEIPENIIIQGVDIFFFIDYPTKSLNSSTRNGIKSRSSIEIIPYTIRILKFQILTEFDNLPNFINIEQYIRKTLLLPKFKIGITNEIGLEYNINIFKQIFSQFNIINGFFSIYKFFFYFNNNRYEIIPDEHYSFKILKYDTLISLKDIKQNRKLKTTIEEILINIYAYQIIPTEFGLKIKDFLFEPILNLYISMFFGRIGLTR